MVPQQRFPVVNYCLAAATVLLALVLTWLIRPLQEIQVTLFFAAVTVSVWLGGLGPGLLATVLSILAVDFFFVEPHYSILTHPDDLIRVAAFTLVAWMTCMLNDLRRRAEKALAQSEARYRRLFQEDLTGDFLATPDGRLLLCNRAFAQLFGLGSAEEARSAQVLELFPDKGVQESYLTALRTGGEIPVHERELERPDGQKLLVLERLAGQFDAGGALVQVQGYLLDITERKRAEEARARLAAIVESSEDAIISTTLDGTVVSWNRGAERLYGYAAAEVVGQPLGLLLPPDRAAEVAAVLERVQQGGHVEPYETVRIGKDGSRREVSVAVSPVLGVDGRVVGAAAIVRDISERNRLLHQLRHQAEELAQADRRKDEFLATLAHELRNPLAPIRNAMHLLRRPALDATTREQARELMDRQVGQLTRLVDDLLDVSRISRGKIQLRKEPVDLAVVVRRAVEVTRPLIEAQEHELSLSLPTEPLALEADPVRLEQILVNLHTNAAKYTEPGGRIGLSAEREGSWVMVRVQDGGIGIAPEMLPRVFDLFIQVDSSRERSQGGLGIGLSLVRRLVEMHGGTVAAFSAGLGQGSEFVVRLPWRPAVAARQGGLHLEATQPTAPARKVLVVYDNRDAAESLALVLRLDGHEVHLAHDGPAALEAFEHQRPDVVFLDIGLPGLNGYQVARRLREQTASEELRLVALTGYGQAEDRRRSREAGFDLHLTKPVDPEQVAALLAGPAPRASCECPELHSCS